MLPLSSSLGPSCLPSSRQIALSIQLSALFEGRKALRSTPFLIAGESSTVGRYFLIVKVHDFFYNVTRIDI